MDIKEARMNAGLSIAKVSEITGVPYRSLQNWELGERKPPEYVKNMVINIIENFDKKDYQTFIEEFLEMLEFDIRLVKTDETRRYIGNLITDVSEFLHK